MARSLYVAAIQCYNNWNSSLYSLLAGVNSYLFPVLANYMALLRASELDASLRRYFQSEVKRLHQRGSCGHAKIKQLWEMWYQHRGHAANLSLASDRYQVMSVCELPCHCPDQASTFQAFLNWKELSIAEQEHLMTKLVA